VNLAGRCLDIQLSSIGSVATGERVPELSLVMPCFNEENCLDLTVPPLLQVFQQAGVDLELILVDNGSTDRTSAVIDGLIARGLPIVKGRRIVNQGQGLGIRSGLQMSRGPMWVISAPMGRLRPRASC